MVVELRGHRIPSLLDQSALEFSVEDSHVHPSVVRHIYLQACHSSWGIIASVNGVLINRSACRGQFLRTMHTESTELYDPFQRLFDRYGRLRPEFLNNEYHKGSDSWGDELNDGLLFYITSVEVKCMVGPINWSVYETLKYCAVSKARCRNVDLGQTARVQISL